MIADNRKQIQASIQRVQYFQTIQIQIGIKPALKIPLHSKIRWGTAISMLQRAHRLRKVSHT